MIADLNMLAILSLTAVMMVGMPHGALDGAVAVAVGYGKRWQDITRFALVYIAIAVLVILIWMVFPITSLMAFMVMSMIHFGLGDHNTRHRMAKIVQIMCHGGIVVIVIPHLHHDAVTPIFMSLTDMATVSELSLFWPALSALGGVFIAATLAYTVLAWRIKSIRLRYIEFLILGMLVSILPPLTGFALYFCAVHTPRHVSTIIHTIKSHDRNSKILPLTALFTVLTWIIAAAILLFRPTEIHLNDAILRVIFIGLAALTVPHMMLVDGVFRPKFLNSNQDDR